MLTLAIIKPDAVHAGKTGKILAHLESAGFQIRAARLVKLTTAQAEAFYAVHRERPFYRSLVAFMTSWPVRCGWAADCTRRERGDSTGRAPCARSWRGSVAVVSPRSP